MDRLVELAMCRLALRHATSKEGRSLLIRCRKEKAMASTLNGEGYRAPACRT